MFNGIQLMNDNLDSEDIEVALRVEVHGLKARHKAGKQLFIVMGKYAPAFGLLTTVIGEIKMFLSMGTGTAVGVSAIGAGMGFALIGTMYGVIISNLICLPIADKLEAKGQDEAMVRELYIQGVLSIANNDLPSSLMQKMVGFLDKRTADRLEPAT